MEIIVDRGRCTGIGICESLDPARFEVGDNGALVIMKAEVSEDELSAAEEAVRSCPAAALRLHAAGTAA
ncbi:ferredoxin [Leifsonia sp. AG29]|uniref:ferredoxin n=1 Tax=Leifsonia sp. AG29 TaxID=2598860 RepID=UPI00131D25F4|nr:ferredoxin [Leifsonia sp. AG29]